MSSITDKIRQMRAETKQKETKLTTSSSKRGSYMAITDLEEGKTTVRIVKHERDDISFVPFRSTWLEVNESINNLSRYHLSNIIKEKKLEKVLGIKDVKDLEDKSDEEVRNLLVEELGSDFTRTVNKRVFISKVHGNPEIPDIIEEYIKFAQSHAKDVCQDTDEQKKMIAPIRGYRDKSGKWISGIMPSTSYVTYMFEPDSKEKDIKRLEIWDSHMNSVEKLYASFDTEEDPLAIDPFSDPNEGVPLVIEKSKNEKGKFDYDISDKKNTSRTGTYTDFVKQFSVSKEQLDNLLELESLTEIYVNIYGRRDFEIALNGLQLFDEKNNINIFNNDEFLSIVEDISIHYDTEEKEEKKESTKEIKKEVKKEEPVKIKPKEVVKPVVKEKQEVKPTVKPGPGSLFGDSIEELKEYIVKHNMDIRIRPRDTFEDIVEFINEELEALGSKDMSEDETPSDDGNMGEIENNSFEESAEAEKPKIDIEALRNKLRRG